MSRCNSRGAVILGVSLKRRDFRTNITSPALVAKPVFQVLRLLEHQLPRQHQGRRSQSWWAAGVVNFLCRYRAAPPSFVQSAQAAHFFLPVAAASAAP